MKRIVIGITFMLSGLFLYWITHQYAAPMMLSISQESSRFGNYGQALYKTGGIIPNIAGVMFIVLGAVILLKEYKQQY
ncbi:MAG: hypothetical protein MJB12_05320 [Firmicutes bacterium]|nr:hypothetical protein [Bacillota bacterium]